ncbi:MAG: response regulator transcription factor [Candidatus Brocadiaceae bacterium]|nr:response regulator transcription factor [Candidatus Brocadiaceae bacterium]
MPDETILIVEDDAAMLEGLKGNFEFEGYRVLTAADGETGLSAALDARPDLIVLDIMLPRINGYEVCRLIRREGLEMPVIMLTAKGQESDVVLGLELGADDYVTKPFGVLELMARVAALLRRRRRERPQVIRFGPFALDLQARRLSRDGEEIHVTPKQFDLLVLLVEREGRALTRNQMLNAVWGHSVFVTPRSVDQCVNTLRRQIEPDQHRPIYIQTVRGIGYRFDAPPHES